MIADFPRLATAAALLAAPFVILAAPALAQPAPGPTVALDSALFVEHTRLGAGSEQRSLEPATRFVHGERVVTLLTWYRLAGTGGFTITNALPAGLNYQKSADSDEDVSVDGGRSWGHLGTLKIGTRLASPEDVTHVRWHVTPAQALAGSGRIAYSGFVR